MVITWLTWRQMEVSKVYEPEQSAVIVTTIGCCFLRVWSSMWVSHSRPMENIFTASSKRTADPRARSIAFPQLAGHRKTCKLVTLKHQSPFHLMENSWHSLAVTLTA